MHSETVELPLEPVKICNMGSKGKFSFLHVFVRQAVFWGWVKLTNWGITEKFWEMNIFVESNVCWSKYEQCIKNASYEGNSISKLQIVI